MSFLLDTHVLLWALYQPTMLPHHWQETLMAPENTVLFSAISIAEIAIKKSLHRPDFPFPPERVCELARDTGFDELHLSARHASELATLPFHHRDPFDRLLVAQARAETCRLITADRALVRYSDLVTLID